MRAFCLRQKHCGVCSLWWKNKIIFCRKSLQEGASLGYLRCFSTGGVLSPGVGKVHKKTDPTGLKNGLTKVE